jgi:hypothetical protein
MTIAASRNFRGLRWSPTSEQEVVLLFGRLLGYLPQPLTIDFVGTTFPDCKATDSETRETIWIEFELKSSHFYRDHKDRVEQCNWIVCWEDDWDGNLPALWKDRPPTIVALKDLVEKIPERQILNTRVETDPKNLFSLRVQALPTEQQHRIEQLLSVGSNPFLKVVWPETNGACFTVRGNIAGHDVECFKLSSTGMIGTPFSRWKKVPPEIRTAVAQQLNDALSIDWFSDGRKGSRYIGELLTSDEQLQRFIGVWRGLVSSSSKDVPKTGK